MHDSLDAAGESGGGVSSGGASDSISGGSDSVGDGGRMGVAAIGGSDGTHGDGGGADGIGGSAGAAVNDGGGGQSSGGAGASSAGASGSNIGGGGQTGTQEQLLSVGKPATASSQQVGNEIPLGNDTSTTTRWCAVDGTFPQWWRVDLGDNHDLKRISLNVQHTDRVYSFTVDTSLDDAAYTKRLSASATGTTQSFTLPAGINARYVRITISNVVPASVDGFRAFISFYDFSVYGF